MQIYKAPIDDVRFLFEVFDYAQLTKLPGYEDFDLTTAMDMIDHAGKFCTNELLPLNRVGDTEGLKYDPETHTVTTPKGFKELYKHFVENGLLGLSQPPEYGGGGAPNMLGLVLSEFATATNKSFSMCAGLSHGLIDALLHHGTEQQKASYLEKLVSGEWAGTMCLTEPQCGTDLGLLTTTAKPEADHYRLSGTKIWITFGEHDLADNIIHLVLARLPDSPEGIKGISLFVVPKFLLEDGTRNTIFCGGLEHKMGINASPTCVMNIENAIGYLVGEPHKGMRGMFTMMNVARLSVGLEGVALSDIAYQTALEFAKERRQGRSLVREKRAKEHPADNIMVHPDVRRMLLNIKASNEGMRALGMWVSLNLDLAEKHPDEDVQEDSSDLVALLTPVVKSFMTERGFANISEAMQVCGGAGYTTDWSIEQYMRDARIAMIYEGTNHIQALDLVGRKLPEGMGRLYQKFHTLIGDLIRKHKDNKNMAEFVNPMKKASKKLNEMTMLLSAKGMEDPEEAAAVASNYLNLFALTAIAYVWCRQVEVALTRSDKFAATKVKTARYFMTNILPESESLVAIIKAGKQQMMDMEVDEF